MDWEIRFHGKYRQDLMIRPRFCHRVKTTGGKWVFPPPLSIYLTAWSGVGLVIWFDCLHPRLISMFFFWDVREKCVIEEDAWGYFWAANWLVHKTWRFHVFREYRGQRECLEGGCNWVVNVARSYHLGSIKFPFGQLLCSWSPKFSGLPIDAPFSVSMSKLI